MSDRPFPDAPSPEGPSQDGARSGLAEPPSRSEPHRRLSFDVVIATRNRPQILALSLPLLLAQSRRPQKLIIVDSSDDHAAVRRVVLDATRGSDVPLELQHSAAGSSLQRNLGLARVESDVVFFPDDDSLLLPGAFDAVMRIYERDEAGAIGGVCAAATYTPPPGVLRRVRASYPKAVWRGLRRGIYICLCALEDRLAPPDPFVIYGRSRWNVQRPPPWLAEENASLAEFMWGFRMSFRTASIRQRGFDETLAGYALHEDADASFQVMRHQLLVCAHNAEIYHCRPPGQRDSGHRMGVLQVLNYAYVLLRHAGRGSAADRAMKPHFRYQFVRCAKKIRSRYGREQFAGIRVALRVVPELRDAAPEKLSSRYIELRDRCFAQLEGNSRRSAEAPERA